uniref:Uncharacterized protein n=1 Tax=Anguilla anguilla TaxID=7936 RepID=A0A0E9SKV5_ANGAN
MLSAVCCLLNAGILFIYLTVTCTQL